MALEAPYAPWCVATGAGGVACPVAASWCKKSVLCQRRRRRRGRPCHRARALPSAKVSEAQAQAASARDCRDKRPRQRAHLRPRRKHHGQGKGRGQLCWAASPCLDSSWAGICGCGLGLGLLLHWLVPAIDRGMATLCGLVATGLALLAFGQLMTLTEPSEAEEESPPVWRLRPLPRPARAARRPRKRP